MKAHAIIGANYGDEGKGHITDYICAQNGADVVVRFNGGAQAGHTVVTPTGERHVFHHLGSGSFLGIPTFLSKYFIVNPVQFNKEWGTLPRTPVYVDPSALVTTPVDMLINQALQRKHGECSSCGIGINETMQRSANPNYRLTVANMMDRNRLRTIREEWVPMRAKELGITVDNSPLWWELHFEHADLMMVDVECHEKPVGTNIIFEGAQGLMLDQDSTDFPYVTHSKTGLHNVLEICRDWGVVNLHTTYVTRSYLTRHGAGPLPGELPLPAFVKDATNIDHEFQGALRYAPLDAESLEARIRADADISFDVAVTCLDQHYSRPRFNAPIAYTSWGPTRNDVVTELVAA